MQVGLYKVRVTHPSKTIPERYHTHTVLGEEVAPGTFDIQIHLKSNQEPLTTLLILKEPWTVHAVIS